MIMKRTKVKKKCIIIILYTLCLGISRLLEHIMTKSHHFPSMQLIVIRLFTERLDQVTRDKDIFTLGTFFFLLENSTAFKHFYRILYLSILDSK